MEEYYFVQPKTEWSVPDFQPILTQLDKLQAEGTHLPDCVRMLAVNPRSDDTLVTGFVVAMSTFLEKCVNGRKLLAKAVVQHIEKKAVWQPTFSRQQHGGEDAEELLNVSDHMYEEMTWTQAEVLEVLDGLAAEKDIPNDRLPYYIVSKRCMWNLVCIMLQLMDQEMLTTKEQENLKKTEDLLKEEVNLNRLYTTVAGIQQYQHDNAPGEARVLLRKGDAEKFRASWNLEITAEKDEELKRKKKETAKNFRRKKGLGEDGEDIKEDSDDGARKKPKRRSTLDRTDFSKVGFMDLFGSGKEASMYYPQYKSLLPTKAKKLQNLDNKGLATLLLNIKLRMELAFVNAYQSSSNKQKVGMGGAGTAGADMSDDEAPTAAVQKGRFVLSSKRLERLRKVHVRIRETNDDGDPIVKAEELEKTKTKILELVNQLAWQHFGKKMETRDAVDDITRFWFRTIQALPENPTTFVEFVNAFCMKLTPSVLQQQYLNTEEGKAAFETAFAKTSGVSSTEPIKALGKLAGCGVFSLVSVGKYIDTVLVSKDKAALNALSQVVPRYMIALRAKIEKAVVEASSVLI